LDGLEINDLETRLQIVDMLFPELKGQRFGYVNMNQVAKAWFAKYPERVASENPLLDPTTCQAMMDEIHAEFGFAISYGGWLEDRSTLWRGSYLDEAKIYLHLGVDVNAPAGTAVAVDRHAEVIRVDDDTPLVGGWGNRVILRLRDEPIVLIYAHLAKDVVCKIGDQLAPGDVFAKLGASSENGYWMPHVHVQAVEQKYFDSLLQTGQLDVLDGYGSQEERELLAQRFPDPMRFIQLDS